MAIVRSDWPKLEAAARGILRLEPENPEGFFLHAMAEKARGNGLGAVDIFRKVVDRDGARYDAAVELAYQLARGRRHGDADALLRRYLHTLSASPVYLSLAGTVSTMLGLHQQAYDLHAQAAALQPEIDAFQASLAACEVTIGQFQRAVDRYCRLVARNPKNQRNHYELSQLVRARDRGHIEQMAALISHAGDRPDCSIWLRYAIAKELEDIECWDEAFVEYERAGRIAVSLGRYDVSVDTDIMRLLQGMSVALAEPGPSAKNGVRLIFVVGLPRTGSTIIERIFASHSEVNSLGETRYLEWSLANVAGEPLAGLTEDILMRAANADPAAIRRAYLEAISFRIDQRPVVLDKLPENFLYLKFIVEAFPEAAIIYVQRKAMDNCFAMFKQSFFRFAYTLKDLAQYYIAHRELLEHWRRVLGPRLIETSYEDLIGDQEGETRRLLAASRLDFEAACLAFDRNVTPVATASSAQVRERIHSRSVDRWRCFEAKLLGLRAELEAAGIDAD